MNAGTMRRGGFMATWTVLVFPKGQLPLRARAVVTERQFIWPFARYLNLTF